MKKVIYLFALLIMLLACGKNEDTNDLSVVVTPIKNLVTTEITDVKTFEVVSLTLSNNDTSLKESYQGKFGGVPVEIIKSDHNSLVFSIPELDDGKYDLTFELGKIEFNVKKTEIKNYEKIISDVFSNVVTNLSNLDTSNSLISEKVSHANEFHKKVKDLYNSLTKEEKRLTALYFEANKNVFKEFSDNIGTVFNGPTSLKRRLQTDCPRFNSKDFYICTAENIGTASVKLTKSIIKVVEILTLAKVSLSIVSATVPPLAIAGAGIAAVTAVYIFFDSILPAITKFYSSLKEFLLANWIFARGTFEVIVEEFTSESLADLNVKPKFRAIRENDTDISEGVSFFIKSYGSLRGYWNKFTSIFGTFEEYKNTSEIVALKDNEITISNISNSNVQLVSQSGQKVKFKSLSGNNEKFNYDIEITKGGFNKKTSKSASIIVTNNFSMDINNQSWHPTKVTLFDYTQDNRGIYLIAEDDNYKFRGWIYNYNGIGAYSFPSVRGNNIENYFRLTDKNTGINYTTFCENNSMFKITSLEGNDISGIFLLKVCELNNKTNIIKLTNGHFRLKLTNP